MIEPVMNVFLTGPEIQILSSKMTFQKLQALVGPAQICIFWEYMGMSRNHPTFANFACQRQKNRNIFANKHCIMFGPDSIERTTSWPQTERIWRRYNNGKWLKCIGEATNVGLILDCLVLHERTSLEKTLAKICLYTSYQHDIATIGP